MPRDIVHGTIEDQDGMQKYTHTDSSIQISRRFLCPGVWPWRMEWGITAICNKGKSNEDF